MRQRTGRQNVLWGKKLNEVWGEEWNKKGVENDDCDMSGFREGIGQGKTSLRQLPGGKGKQGGGVRRERTD